LSDAKESPETTAGLDLQVRPVPEVCPDFPAKTEKQEETEKPDPSVLQVRQEREVYRACQVYLDPKATEGSQVWMVQRVNSEVPEKRERLAVRVPLAQVDPWDLLVLGVNEEGKAHPALLA
jgi:hypothetical protein